MILELSWAFPYRPFRVDCSRSDPDSLPGVAIPDVAVSAAASSRAAGPQQRRRRNFSWPRRAISVASREVLLVDAVSSLGVQGMTRWS